MRAAAAVAAAAALFFEEDEDDEDEELEAATEAAPAELPALWRDVTALIETGVASATFRERDDVDLPVAVSRPLWMMDNCAAAAGVMVADDVEDERECKWCCWRRTADDDEL